MEAQELEKAKRELMDERVRMYETRIAELKETHRRETDRLEGVNKRELVMANDRVRALEEQNDALLGAVAKLHGFQAKAEAAERDHGQYKLEMTLQYERLKDDCGKHLREVERLKAELAKAGKPGA